MKKPAIIGGVASAIAILILGIGALGAWSPSGASATAGSVASTTTGVGGHGYASGRQATDGQATVNVATLDDAERQDLLFMWEEEKLARDVYEALSETYAEDAFSAIAASESRHLAALDKRLAAYRLSDPSDVDQRGVYQNSELQILYASLMAQGDSLAAALEVGIAIEETDIEDLERAIDDTDNADLARVYENLLRGSQNHLGSYSELLAATRN